MRRILWIAIAALVVTAVTASTASAQYGGGGMGSSKGKVILSFKAMRGVDGPFLGAANAIRGVDGDEPALGREVGQWIAHQQRQAVDHHEGAGVPRRSRSRRSCRASTTSPSSARSSAVWR